MNTASDCRIIPLTRGYIALVDEEDYERVSTFKWQASVQMREGRVVGVGARKSDQRLMHRFILDLPPRQPFVDHKNHNGLDNRRANLRLCDNRLNQGNAKLRQKDNTSGFRGVTRNKGAWHAQIRANKVTTYLGRFQSAEEAARVYDAEALRIFGEFANLNFPREEK